MFTSDLTTNIASSLGNQNAFACWAVSWSRDYLCFDCDSFVTATRVKNGFCGDLADLAEILNRSKRWRFLLLGRRIGTGVRNRKIERVTLLEPC